MIFRGNLVPQICCERKNRHTGRPTLTTFVGTIVKSLLDNLLWCCLRIGEGCDRLRNEEGAPILESALKGALATVNDTTFRCGSLSTGKPNVQIPIIAYRNRKRLQIVPKFKKATARFCLLYTSPSPRDRTRSRMPSSA